MPQLTIRMVGNCFRVTQPRCGLPKFSGKPILHAWDMPSLHIPDGVGETGLGTLSRLCMVCGRGTLRALRIMLKSNTILPEVL